MALTHSDVKKFLELRDSFQTRKVYLVAAHDRLSGLPVALVCHGEISDDGQGVHLRPIAKILEGDLDNIGQYYIAPSEVQKSETN